MEDLDKIALSNGTMLKAGEYHIENVLAKGSTAIVYLAKDPQKNDVVIKEFYPPHLLNRDLDKKTLILHAPSNEREYNQYMESFQRECFITKALKGQEGFVQYIDKFWENQTTYLVLQYELGEWYVPYMNRIDEQEKKRCLLEIAGLIKVLHHQGILHLDIKPSNILFTSDGHPILIDFGNAACGYYGVVQCISPNYAAPELKKKKTGTKRSDIYSFGKLIQNTLCQEERTCFLNVLLRWSLQPTYRLKEISLFTYKWVWGMNANLKVIPNDKRKSASVRRVYENNISKGADRTWM